MKYLQLTLWMLVAFMLTSCGNKEVEVQHKIEYDKLVKDYFSETPEWKIFSEADSLKWSRAYEVAATAFEKVLNETKNLKGEALAYAWNQLAYCYLMSNQEQVAAAILSKIENTFLDKDVALGAGASGDYYLNLGMYQQKEGQGEQSIFNLKKALTFYEQVYKDASVKKIQTLSTLSFAYRFLTLRVDSFTQYADHAYDLLVQEHTLTPYAASTYYMKAHSCWMKRDHETGEAICNLAITTAQNNPLIDTLFLAECYSLSARCIRKDASRKAEALGVFKRAAALGEGMMKEDLRVQKIYEDLLSHYAFQQDSIRLFEGIKKLEDRYSPEELLYVHPDRLKGLYYSIAGQYQKSITWYNQFLRRYKKAMNPDIRFLDDAYYGLRDAHLRLGQLDSAEYYVWEKMGLKYSLDAALLNWESLPLPVIKNNLHIYNSYHQLAEISRKHYLRDKTNIEALKRSFKLYQLVDEMVYSAYDSFDEDAGLSAARDYFTAIYQSAVETSYLLYQVNQNQDVIQWASHFMERLKSPLFYRELAGTFQQSFPEVPDHVFEKEQLLNNQIRALKQTRFGRDEYEFSKLLKAKETLYANIEKEYPRYYQTKMGQVTSSLEQIQNTLERTEVMLNFMTAGEHYYLLCIQSDTLAFYQLDTIVVINEKIQWLTNYLSDQKIALNKDHIPVYFEKAHELFDALVAPVFSMIPEQAHLILMADGLLSEVPFDALLTERVASESRDFKTLPYFLKKASISYAPSITSWLHLKATSKKIERPSILAYAYSDPGPIAQVLRSPKLSEIPGTGAELETIEQLYPESSRSLQYGRESTKAHFLNNCHRSFNVFHFALHARSGGSDRLDNVIYFRGNPVDSLFGYEVIPLQLNGALAVLTACQTAKGKITQGEGTYSLSRSFLLSGFKNVISSLWEIDDRSTADIIRSFYTYLSEAVPPHQSLHAAKIQYLETTDAIFSHPFFWSGMICVGR